MFRPVLLISPGIGSGSKLEHSDPESVLVDCGFCGLSEVRNLERSVFSLLAEHRHAVGLHDFYRAARGSTVPALPPPREGERVG